MGVRSQIVAYCRKQLGCAYSYTPSGGREGSSYNCSFLSTCAYKAAGLKIPHWQGHQNADGSQSDWVYRHGHWTTDPSKLKPGDLVFFSKTGSRKNTYHVGISLGGYDMIDSVPIGGVQKRKLYADFVGGGWPLKSLPKESTPTVKAGTYECVVSWLNIRTNPSMSGKVIDDHYTRGEKVNLDGYSVVADGYLWGRYKGAKSGKWRYVAVRKVGGDTYLRKV